MDNVEAVSSQGGEGPDIVAVTVTYNSASVLDEFIACAQRQHGNWRLVIVDNDSTDDTRKKLAAISDDRIHIILSDRNGGFAAGSNQGIRWAVEKNAKSILLINNDTSFEPKLFQHLFDKLSDNGIDAVSPLILFENEPRHIWYAGGDIQWKRAVRNVHFNFGEEISKVCEEDFEVTFVPLCCAAIKSSVFEKIGVIDEDYFVYWEDVDFSHRMNLAGMRTIVTPGITMLHKESVLTGGLMSEFSTRQYYKNRVIFVRKALGPMGATVQIGLIVCAVVGRTLLKGDSFAMLRLRLRSMWEGVRANISPILSGR